MDELETAQIEPLLLPLPADPRALNVATCVLRIPADAKRPPIWRGSAG
jgi:hypothetical protein